MTIGPIEIQVPTNSTLKKYGFGCGPAAYAEDPAEDWKGLLASQGGVCPVCEKTPKTGRFVVDHEHVVRWKDMAPEQRRQYVRGLTCWYCNHSYLGRGITADKAANACAYLIRYQERRP